MDLGLDGRVVVVTGGSSGIGLALVRLLLAEGVRVATCGRSPERLEQALAPLLADHGHRLLAQPADVTDAAAMARLMAATVDRWGGIDGLVNNAGQSRLSTFATTTDDEWREELDRKFFGLLHPLRAAEPALRASGQGAVVNLGAVLARQPEGRLVATSAARAGALNLSKSLAQELAPAIRVNAVLLGLIDTGQWRRRFDEADTDLDYGQWCAELAADRGVPLARLGWAEEVAPTVALLLSPRSAYTTGTTIDVAGGVARYV